MLYCRRRLEIPIFIRPDVPVMNFVGNLGYVGVVILGGYLAVRDTIGVGDILAFIQYLRSFTMPITQTTNIANMLQSTAAAAERVFEFLDEPEEVEAGPRQAVKLEKVEGHVTFKHVRFGYSPDKIVIHDFSADIKPGQKVAIVGPTGAGKTTMVKLLMRFYDVNSGEHQGGRRGYPRDAARRPALHVRHGAPGYLAFQRQHQGQHPLQQPEATDEQVVAAAKMAYVDRFVRALPHGYDIELNEESSNISQGQKQLLTIARAFLADPKMLILDEATSSVDTRTEMLIQKAMAELDERTGPASSSRTAFPPSATRTSSW